MEFLSLREGEPFVGKIPDKLRMPVVIGIGSGIEVSNSSDEDALIRWMYLQGYVPEDEYEEEKE